MKQDRGCEGKRLDNLFHFSDLCSDAIIASLVPLIGRC